MELQPEQLSKFMALYERKYSIALTLAEAQPLLLMLLEYVSLGLKPINKNDINDMPDIK